MAVLITGAAGNLGSRLARHLADRGYQLNCMIHRKDIPSDIARHSNVTVFRADLSKPETLVEPCRSATIIVHFAGVLFKPFPHKFLPITNTVYFQNLVDISIKMGTKKIILVSFPHVEGETTPWSPSTGRMNGNPQSIHARTRLDQERHLFKNAEAYEFIPVSLRSGLIYGKGILMIEAAKWLLRRRLLGVWKDPTWIHCISIDDFLAAVEAAIANENSQGIYNLGDDDRITLQGFLDKIADYWGTRRPLRLPVWLIFFAAWLCEISAFIVRTKAPLTRDFIRIGRISYYGDTARMKQDLIQNLKHPTLDQGITILEKNMNE